MPAPDWLHRRAQLSPEAIALHEIATGQKLNYRQWNAQVNQTAHLLWGIGATKQKRVAILSRNCLAYLDLFMAANKLGYILQLLNWRLSNLELSSLIDAAEPIILAYDQASQEQAEALGQAYPHLRLLPIFGSAQGSLEERQNYTRERSSAWPEISPQDTWVLCYTGGSTGRPKAAQLTHENILANAIYTSSGWGLSARDITLLNAPLFHTGGLNVFTAPLIYLGGKSLLCDDFDPEQVLRLVPEYQVSIYFGVPTMFNLMIHHSLWKEVSFDSLRWVISGGAPCPEEIFSAFFQKGIEFKTGYGLTEAGPNNFWLPSSFTKEKPGSVGAPLFHVEARLLDAEGQESDQGELFLRGPHVFSGYLGQEQASREAIDGQGWLHTGDLARRDSDGHYFIIGRKKEMYISGGENIYPAEIELCIEQHPHVQMAAVVAYADEKWGELGCAFVQSDGELEAQELRNYLLDKLARYKLPRRYIFLTELPKTGTGKIDKRGLKKYLEARDDSVVV